MSTVKKEEIIFRNVVSFNVLNNHRLFRLIVLRTYFISV